MPTFFYANNYILVHLRFDCTRASVMEWKSLKFCSYVNPDIQKAKKTNQCELVYDANPVLCL